MTPVDYLLAQIVNGLSAGCIYAVAAIGYSMVFGVLQMHNFAHGDTLMFGTFVALSLMLAGIPVGLALPLAIALGAAIGYAVERIAFRPTRGAHRMVPTVSAIGVALIIRNAAQSLWGTTTQAFPIAIPASTFKLFGIGISTTQVAVFVTACVLMLATQFFVNRTLIGKAMRAVQQDADAAGYMGIPVNRVVSFVYMIGGALGVAAGILFSINYNTVFLMMGFSVMIKAFVSAVIGGIGNIRGAFIGGLLLGVTEALTAGYLSSGYRDAITFVVLILVLLVRPQGLLGRPMVVKV
jgi:branched-chain amino acid transport system permease protein